MYHRRCCLGILFGCLFPTLPLRAAESPTPFEEVAPLLQKRCLSCHSGDKPKGELSLATRNGVLEGGSSGPAVVAGDAARSLLLEKVRDKQMPPKEPLADAEIA